MSDDQAYYDHMRNLRERLQNEANTFVSFLEGRQVLINEVRSMTVFTQASMFGLLPADYPRTYPECTPEQKAYLAYFAMCLSPVFNSGPE